MYTSKEAMAIIGVTRTTLSRYVKDGLLHPVPQEAGRSLFPKDEVDEFDYVRPAFAEYRWYCKMAEDDQICNSAIETACERARLNLPNVLTSSDNPLLEIDFLLYLYKYIYQGCLSNNGESYRDYYLKAHPNPHYCYRSMTEEAYERAVEKCIADFRTEFLQQYEQ